MNDNQRIYAEYQAMVVALQGKMVTPIKQGFEDNIAHGIIGINDEAGELISILKQKLYYGVEYNEKHLLEECGDLLHYLFYMMIEYGWTMEDLMKHNKHKCGLRYPNGFNIEDAVKRKDKQPPTRDVDCMFCSNRSYSDSVCLLHHKKAFVDSQSCDDWQPGGPKAELTAVDVETIYKVRIMKGSE